MISEIDYFDNVFEGLSCPFEDYDDDLISQWVAVVTRTQLREFIDQASVSAALEPGAQRELEALLESLNDFRSVWTPSLGALFTARRASAEAIAQELLTGVAAGPRNEPAPAHPTPDDRTSGSGPALATQSRNALTATAAPMVAHWRLRSEADREGCAGAVTDEMCHALAGGIRLVEASSPHYSTWVSRVVRYVLPITRRRSEVNSWSSLQYPSLVAMSLFDSPTDMAETLVHEASHQYYHIAERLSPLIEPGMDTPYYSPIKQTERPLSMILLAYHAFANVVLFFSEAERAGTLPSTAIADELSDVSEALPQMEATLDAAAASLTPAGRCLYLPLKARLALRRQASGG